MKIWEVDSTHPLASASVAENLAVVLLGGADEGTCQYWPGKTGSEKISVLVNGIALDATENKFLEELLLKVLDHHALGTESQSLLLDGGPVLVLADVAEESNYGVAL
jgi:hypothetical protein